MMKMQGDKLPNSATSSDKDGSIINPTTSFINEDEEESVSTNINKRVNKNKDIFIPSIPFSSSLFVEFELPLFVLTLVLELV